MKNDPRIGLLLQILDSAFERRGWHGTTLRGALRGVSAKQALWRPAAGRNRIWDLALHCAYWKYVVRRRLERGEAGGFARSPADWPAVPGRGTDAAWRADVRLLVTEHQALRAVVEKLDPAALDRWSPRKQWRNAEEIHGVAAHDLYHTGQIQLIKRLRSTRS